MSGGPARVPAILDPVELLFDTAKRLRNRAAELMRADRPMSERERARWQDELDERRSHL